MRLTNQQRSERRQGGADPADHGARTHQRVAHARREQLDGVDVDGAEHHADHRLADQW